jgi:hypothetical protein
MVLFIIFKALRQQIFISKRPTLILRASRNGNVLQNLKSQQDMPIRLMSLRPLLKVHLLRDSVVVFIG